MSSTNILGNDFSKTQLFKYIFPTICMTIFMSTYTIVDGVFVANLVGEGALAAINLIYPIFFICIAIGMMFGSGGNAVIARLMGEGKNEEARQFLSILYVISTIIGILFTVLVYIFAENILAFLQVSSSLHDYAKDYMLTLALSITVIFYLVFTEIFFITAGKPLLGFGLCFLGGITNIILDYFLISPKFANLGIIGAALATGIGYAVAGIGGMLYFSFARRGNLYFVKPYCKFKTFILSLYNGLSELVVSSSASITTIIFNIILIRLAGDSGVAAITVILYVQMFQVAIYQGIAMGASPIIAFKFGEKNKAGLKKIIKQAKLFILISSILVLTFSFSFSSQAVGIFISKDSPTFEMAKNGFLLFAPAYLLMGFNVLTSATFTSLSNGKVSALFSILRTLVFLVIALLTLPNIFGITGVWIAVPIAELMAFLVAIYLYKRYKKAYLQ